MDIRSFFVVTVFALGIGMSLALVIHASTPTSSFGANSHTISVCARMGLNCG